MTAILALDLGDRVATMTDTAWLDPSTGSIASLRAKMVVLDEASSVFALTGTQGSMDFATWLQGVKRPFCSAADLWERMPAEWREFHEAQNALRNDDAKIEADRFRVVVASILDGQPRLGVFFGPYGHGELAVAGYEPWSWYPAASLIDGVPWLIRTGIPVPYPSEFRQFVERERNDPRRTFHPLIDGLPLFEAQRRCRGDSGHYCIGGGLDFVELTSVGEVTREHIAPWPGDAIGQPINPHSEVLA